MRRQRSVSEFLLNFIRVFLSVMTLHLQILSKAVIFILRLMFIHFVIPSPIAVFPDSNHSVCSITAIFKRGNGKSGNREIGEPGNRGMGESRNRFLFTKIWTIERKELYVKVYINLGFRRLLHFLRIIMIVNLQRKLRYCFNCQSHQVFPWSAVFMPNIL